MIDVLVIKEPSPQVQRRPWMMMARWLGRKLLAPDDNKPPSPDGYLAKLAKIALSPLKIVMEPFVPGAYYQKTVFERLIQRALWSPVAKYKFLALGIPAAHPANGRSLILLVVFGPHEKATEFFGLGY